MANTIHNLVEALEFNEPDSKDSFINCRMNLIDNFSEFGPTDLVYLIKQNKGFLSKGSPKGFLYLFNNILGYYHFVYGLDVSSPASVSTYVNTLINTNLKTNNITKAIIAIFNFFDRVDVRIEIKIPGGIDMYGISKEKKMLTIDDSMWEKTYVSSAIRSLIQKKIPMKNIKILKELSTKKEMDFFLETVQKLVKKGVDIKSDTSDILQYMGNRILYEICNYLLKKQRFVIAYDYFSKIIVNDPKYSVFLSEILNKFGRFAESVKLLAPILTENPHTISMLLKQSQSLIQLEKYDYALRLAIIVVQLVPDSLSALFNLMEVYFYLKNYEMALLTINICQISNKKSYNDAYTEIEFEYTKPKNYGDSDTFVFNFEPKKPEFIENLNRNDENAVEKINEKLEKVYADLPGQKLNYFEEKIYKILVKIEREITWDELSKIKNNLFIMEDEFTSINIKKFEHFSLNNKNITKIKKIEDYEIEDNEKPNYLPNSSINEKSFLAIKAGAEGILDLHSKKVEKKIVDREKIDEMSADSSESETELPSFLKNETDLEASETLKKNMENIKQEGDNKINVWEKNRKKKITELTNESIETEPNKENQKEKINHLPMEKVIEEEGEDHKNIEPEKEYNLNDINSKEDDLPLLLNENLLKVHSMNDMGTFSNDYRRKRMSSRLLEKLFFALFEDLTALYEWQNEEKSVVNQKKEGEENSQESGGESENEEQNMVSGKVWVLRGQLAERLSRTRTAENAFRKAVCTEFSLYAWHRLLKIYLETDSYKAALVCIAEILDEMEAHGVKKFVFLPKWIEEALYEMISKIGISNTSNLLKELNFEDDNIDKVLREAEFWSTEGTVQAEKENISL